MSLFGGIKKAFKNVAKVALPAVGGIIGGPSGAAMGGAFARTIGPDGVYSGKKPPRNPFPGMGFTQDPRSGGGFGALDPRVPGSLGDRMIPDWLSGPGGGSSDGSPRVLADGRVRYPRRRADGTYYFPRRMNPLNPRAARRAIRRIKAVRRITRDIERSLPKVTTRRRAS